jgi:hypothetical protein
MSVRYTHGKPVKKNNNKNGRPVQTALTLNTWKTGLQKWQYPLPAAIPMPVRYTHGKPVLKNGRLKQTALSLNTRITGFQKWQYPLPAAIPMSMRYIHMENRFLKTAV